MQRARLNHTIEDLRKLYDTFAHDAVADRLKAQTAFLARFIEDPDLLPLIFEAAIGNLETFRAAVVEQAAEPDLPIKYLERLRKGENPIKVYRKYRKMTQLELAESLGVTQPAIARIESTASPNVTVKTLRRIADSLGTSVIHLLPRQG